MASCLHLAGHLQQFTSLLFLPATQRLWRSSHWAAVMACGTLALWPGSLMISLSGTELHVPSAGLSRLHWQCTSALAQLAGACPDRGLAWTNLHTRLACSAQS